MTEENAVALRCGNKLAEIADLVTTEWLRFGGCKPELYKRLQLAVDDWYEQTEES